MTGALVDSIHAVRARIRSAAEGSGRRAEDVVLVAATKDRSAHDVEHAVSLGVTDVGENRAQELLDKRSEITAPVRWHFIGTLQRNKTRAIVGAVVLIHSVESIALAEAIGHVAREKSIDQDVLLEVNTSGERSKHGVRPEEAEEIAHGVAMADGVVLRGLMTIAPQGDPVRARRCFADLRALRDRIAPEIPTATELSMGMTDDFEHAIAEGATIIRVGRAIFGARPR